MAKAIVTLKIMPVSPETNLEEVQAKAAEKIKAAYGETEFKAEQEPVAFGLKALKLTFVIDEEKGSTDDVEAQIAELEEVNSCECVDVRRAVG
tara:strand:+ start:176 stop:454 length:279 start_codon:yes stop_codon:yes gene_type:complete